jgi:hypothetical protein
MSRNGIVLAWAFRPGSLGLVTERFTDHRSARV